MSASNIVCNVFAEKYVAILEKIEDLEPEDQDEIYRDELRILMQEYGHYLHSDLECDKFHCEIVNTIRSAEGISRFIPREHIYDLSRKYAHSSKTYVPSSTTTEYVLEYSEAGTSTKIDKMISKMWSAVKSVDFPDNRFTDMMCDLQGELERAMLTKLILIVEHHKDEVYKTRDICTKYFATKKIKVDDYSIEEYDEEDYEGQTFERVTIKTPGYTSTNLCVLPEDVFKHIEAPKTPYVPRDKQHK
jgi:hypothetical protein